MNLEMTHLRDSDDAYRRQSGRVLVQQLTRAPPQQLNVYIRSMWGVENLYTNIPWNCAKCICRAIEGDAVAVSQLHFTAVNTFRTEFGTTLGLGPWNVPPLLQHTYISVYVHI